MDVDASARELYGSNGGAAGDADDDAAGGEASTASSFSMRSDSLKLLLMAVSSVHNGKRDQYGIVRVSHLGLRINVETAAKSMQATVFVSRERCVMIRKKKESAANGNGTRTSKLFLVTPSELLSE